MALSAYEVGTEAQVSNLSLGSSTKASETTFKGDTLFYGGSAYAQVPLFDDVQFKGGLFYDPLLQYSVDTRVIYRKNFIQFSFGPYLGVFNSNSYLLKPGIHSGFRVDLPGYLFASLKSNSSIGANLYEEGDYQQSLSDLSIGFYVRNAICTAQIETKKFMKREKQGVVIQGRNRYAFITDVFQKNIPYRVQITMAYQELTKTFDYATTTKLKLGSIILGSKLEFQPLPLFRVYADLETSVYNFPLEDSSTDVSLDKFIYDVKLGIVFNID